MQVGEQIEYANGIRATVALVADDGYFILRQDGAGYALCHGGRDSWAFVDEASPFINLD